MVIEPGSSVQPCPAIGVNNVVYVVSAHTYEQLPAPEYPEIAFAGRSNVGKSSLINRLVGRRGLVKVSANPGKTRSINFFLADERLYLVDLPGYGYANVPRSVLVDWQRLITAYLENRTTLRCVVVIIDVRHPLKAQDQELINWLRSKAIPCLVVYTKKDKLSANELQRQTAGLDAALGVSPADRVLFSAKTGEGREKLLELFPRFIY